MNLPLNVNGYKNVEVEKLNEQKNKNSLETEKVEIVLRLTKALLSISSIINALENVIRIICVTDSQLISKSKNEEKANKGIGIEELLNRIATRFCTARFKLYLEKPHNWTSFEDVISKFLALSSENYSTFFIPNDLLPDVDKIVDQAFTDSFKSYFKNSKVVSFDGVPLRAYAGGKPNGKPVIIVPACGMPVELCEHWLRCFAQEHFVVTWESRGLFEEVENFDTIDCDVISQANDLFAVMDHFGVQGGHIMGLCGGAIVALMASCIQPERILSLSLWYGDYELGVDCPKTTHQQDIQLLMSMAGTSRSQATSLQQLFAHPSILANMPTNVAHLILYPYATGELLYRYGKLNGNIMTTNVSHLLDKIFQPTLIVTSEDDTTTHPEGSLYIAKKLSNAILYIAPHGNHLSLFDANISLTELAIKFIEHETLSPSLTTAIFHKLSSQNCDSKETKPKPDNIFVAPRDELECQLTKLLENVLSIQPISIYDNFFDLGGHSLLGAKLLDQIEKTFQKKISLSTFFQAPTIEQLSNLLRQEVDSVLVNYDRSLFFQPPKSGKTITKKSLLSFTSLVPIQTRGNKLPLFGIHILGKGCKTYRSLAHYLGIERPIYGLNYGLAVQTIERKLSPLFRVEDLADHYIKEIQTLQPEGPYFLAGHSFGGLIAFEMAYQLHQQGEKVALLALFDTWSPTAIPETSEEMKLFKYWHNILKNGLPYILKKISGKIKWLKNRLQEKLKKTQIKFVIKSKNFRLIDEAIELEKKANKIAYKDYVPKVYPGKMILFKTKIMSSEPQRGSVDSLLGWQNWVSGGLEVYDVPGTHHSMFREPYIQILVDKLRDCIDKADSNG